MWVPYIVTEILAGGTASNFFLDGVKAKLSYMPMGEQPAWAILSRQAHSNAVENLVLFAPAVLLALNKGVDVDLWATVYLYARLLHYPALISNIPVCRTLCFVTGW